MAKIIIIGRNEIGDRYWHFFKNSHELYSHDSWSPNREILKENWDLAIVCTETHNKGCSLTKKPETKDFLSDYSLIQELIEECNSSLFIVTYPTDPGTIDNIKFATNKNVVCLNWFDNFFIFGGLTKDTKKAVEYFLPIAGLNCRYIQTDSKSCEFLRYAKEDLNKTYVEKCNQIKLICKKNDIDFNLIRELWLNTFQEDLFKMINSPQNEHILQRFEAFKHA